VQSASSPPFLQFLISRRLFSTRFSTELLKTFTGHSSSALFFANIWLANCLRKENRSPTVRRSKQYQTQTLQPIRPAHSLPSRRLFGLSRHSLPNSATSLTRRTPPVAQALLPVRRYLRQGHNSSSRYQSHLASSKSFQRASRDIISSPRRHPARR